jgi:hypothetical protein
VALYRTRYIFQLSVPLSFKQDPCQGVYRQIWR